MRSSFKVSPNDTCHVYKLTDRQRHDIHSTSGEFKVEVEGLYILSFLCKYCNYYKNDPCIYTQTQNLLPKHWHLKKENIRSLHIKCTRVNSLWALWPWRILKRFSCNSIWHKQMNMVCSWPNMLTTITMVCESYRGHCRMWYLLITYNQCYIRSATNLATYIKICIIDTCSIFYLLWWD